MLTPNRHACLQKGSCQLPPGVPAWDSPLCKKAVLPASAQQQLQLMEIMYRGCVLTNPLTPVQGVLQQAHLLSPQQVLKAIVIKLLKAHPLAFTGLVCARAIRVSTCPRPATHFRHPLIISCTPGHNTHSHKVGYMTRWVRVLEPMHAAARNETSKPSYQQDPCKAHSVLCGRVLQCLQVVCWHLAQPLHCGDNGADMHHTSSASCSCTC